MANHLGTRIIAFYLPQFHPIPENNNWWGNGFTEWTNVAKAKPLFRGHYQPHIPADLGFYDLRVPETRIAQTEMAREYGIEGFCYWHYWFAGRRLLERPFVQVLKSGEPKFPFCLAWANQSWSGIWHGNPGQILVEQTYPGLKDYAEHFYAVVDAFGDARYITIEGKPIFLVFRPHELPEPEKFTDYWRELAIKSGLKGIYFIGISSESWNWWFPHEHGFDAAVLTNLQPAFDWVFQPRYTFLDRVSRKLTQKDLRELERYLFRKPRIFPYADAIKMAIPSLTKNFAQYPCVLPNFDNTPRSGLNGVVFHNATPELFQVHLRQAINQVMDREADRRMVFIKSWNEWAEGNYLEPDVKFGRAFLEVVKDEVAQ